MQEVRAKYHTVNAVEGIGNARKLTHPMDDYSYVTSFTVRLDRLLSFRRALVTIDQNQDDPVDRAFINVELALAYQELGNQAEYEASRKSAQELSAAFSDEGLRVWFKSKYERIQ